MHITLPLRSNYFIIVFFFSQFFFILKSTEYPRAVLQLFSPRPLRILLAQFSVHFSVLTFHYLGAAHHTWNLIPLGFVNTIPPTSLAKLSEQHLEASLLSPHTPSMFGILRVHPALANFLFTI